MNEFQAQHIYKNCQRLGINARTMYNPHTDTYEIVLTNGVFIDDYIDAVLFINACAPPQPRNVRSLPDLVHSVMHNLSSHTPICA